MLRDHFPWEPRSTTNIRTPLWGIQSFTESDSLPTLMLEKNGAFTHCTTTPTHFATVLKESHTHCVRWNLKSEENFITGFWTGWIFTNQTSGNTLVWTSQTTSCRKENFTSLFSATRLRVGTTQESWQLMGWEEEVTQQRPSITSVTLLVWQEEEMKTTSTSTFLKTRWGNTSMSMLPEQWLFLNQSRWLSKVLNNLKSLFHCSPKMKLEETEK